ncbi:hypothetical protein SDC9_76870 [bioreactor metagenome]|uniref:Uncharacterized protein n=1 Tax=bioreactor metagenome TaxID=1076179 RepID=A0A644YNW8_9ZZZZ
MIGTDRIGNFLQKHRLTGTGRGDDQRSLTLSDRTEHIDDTGRHILFECFQAKPLIGKERGKAVKRHPHLCHDGLVPVYLQDLEDGEEPFILPRGPDLPIDDITSFQIETLDLGRRDIDVLQT